MFQNKHWRIPVSIFYSLFHDGDHYRGVNLQFTERFSLLNPQYCIITRQPRSLTAHVKEGEFPY